MNDFSQNDKLIIRLPNWIGDALMTYPMLLALKHFKYNFVCLGHPWAASLFGAAGFEVVSSSQVKKISWTYKFFKDNYFDKGIICPKTFSANFPAKFSGLATTGYHFLANNRITYRESAHTVENYFDLARDFLSSETCVEHFDSKVPVSKSNLDSARQIIDNVILSNYIVICPYATNLHKGHNKEWPFWSELCGKIHNYKIVALVAPQDLNRCKRELPNSILSLSEDLPIAGAIMREAKIVLANDSGAMHLASFFGGNTLGLFGVTNAQKTRPWYGDYLIGGNGDFPDVDDVIAEIEKLS